MSDDFKSSIARARAVGRTDMDARQDRVAVLENLVKGGEVLAEIERAGRSDRGVNDVVDRADGDVEIQQVAGEFDDAAIGTVTDQDQSQNHLAEP